MRVLSSHNSLTGYKPKKWYLRIFNVFAKCQTKTIEEQIAAGIKMFDIRVRFNRNYDLVACHGICEYDVDVFDVIQMLEDNKCCYRVVLENKIGGRSTKEEDLDILQNLFLNKNYSHCTYVCDKQKWAAIRNSYCKQRLGEVIYHFLFSWKEIIPIPALYKKKYDVSKLPKDKDKKKTIYWIDFV